MQIVAPYRPIRARDGFAGVGWGVACRNLGIEEFGYDIEPNVVATRTANGMVTPGRDLWLPDEVLSDYDLGIDSPPCQTFSMAGKGTGRKALDDVLRAIEERRYLSIDSLRALGEEVGDARTSLVLTPLFYAARDTPETIVLEQVPSVLPVWERIADELRSWGYSTATAILNAEQYGVPQTRKRAILIARINGVAKMPTPTHSRYYPNDWKRLDPGVLPWVSMAEALHWEIGEGGVIVRSSMGKPKVDGVNGTHEFDPTIRPAHTVTTKSDSWTVQGVEFVSNDKLPHSARRPASAPAPTLTAGHDSGNRVWQWHDRPSTTIAGDPRITAREHHFHGEQNSTSFRVTVEEAAILQSFPADFSWPAVKTAAFKIIGNAVPPLLAEAILREALDLG